MVERLALGVGRGVDAAFDLRQTRQDPRIFEARVEHREGAEELPCVRAEFEDYLRCGVLGHGFLRVVPEHCHVERLVAFSCKKRGF